MPPIRLRLGAVAVWLGVVALGLNALVPIHPRLRSRSFADIRSSRRRQGRRSRFRPLPADAPDRAPRRGRRPIFLRQGAPPLRLRGQWRNRDAGGLRAGRRRAAGRSAAQLRSDPSRGRFRGASQGSSRRLPLPRSTARLGSFEHTPEPAGPIYVVLRHGAIHHGARSDAPQNLPRPRRRGRRGVAAERRGNGARLCRRPLFSGHDPDRRPVCRR